MALSLSSETILGQPLHVDYFRNVDLWFTDLWWSHYVAFFGPECEKAIGKNFQSQTNLRAPSSVIES